MNAKILRLLERLLGRPVTPDDCDLMIAIEQLTIGLLVLAACIYSHYWMVSHCQ